MQALPEWERPPKIIIVIISIATVLILFHFWLHFTNPYSRSSIVQQPYKTSVSPQGISVQKQFDLHTYDSSFARGLGYYKSGFLIMQNTYFGSRLAPSDTVDGIIGDIHKLRFDPSKPYLISGDQFSVLYPRNLGVFYNSLLDPHTALNQQDWQNRQRIYLQSALYALDAFSSAHDLTTTIVPIGPHSAVLTEVHPGSVPSDTLYGVLYALNTLQNPDQYANDTPYRLQTTEATKHIISTRKDDLAKLLAIYLQQVQDPSTGLLRAHQDLASARDGVVRDRSFYDTVVLWKTLALAKQLDISTSDTDLEKMRVDILKTYWDEKEGHFRDDLSSKPKNANYASDWLITLPTGFLNPALTSDQPYLTRSIDFIRKQGIASPFPIKYQASGTTPEAPWAVRTFVPNYGGDAIWSYWGAQYLTLLGQLAHTTGDASYRSEAVQGIKTYEQKIVQYHGFPETFDAQGNFLQNAVYKSIRQTGWVVQFEQARATLRAASSPALASSDQQARSR